MHKSERYRLGTHRGKFVAVRGSGKDRQRKSLGAITEHQAARILARENEHLITHGKSDLAACLALYRQKRADKWNKNDARNERLVGAWFGDLAIDEIDEDVCEQYADERRDAGLAENSIRIELSHLRASLRYAKRRKLIQHCPDVYVPTSNEAREFSLTRDDAQLLIEHSLSGHVQLYVMIALVTGARPSHILQLKHDRVDLDRCIIDFRIAGEKKTNKRRPRVSITETLRDMLSVARVVARTDYVIEYKDGPIKSIKRGIELSSKRAGVLSRTPTGETKTPTPYDLRHTAGTLMAQNGVPIEEIAERLGHEKIDTARRHYMHLLPEHLNRSRDSLDFKPRIERNV